MDKKKLQLGMNPSTASHRLIKDILFRMICESGKNACHQCALPMTRDTFSIEHVVPWLDSDDPVRRFFDQANISFSHVLCNGGAARKPHQKYFSEEARRAANRPKDRDRKRRVYTPEARREKWISKGQ